MVEVDEANWTMENAAIGIWSEKHVVIMLITFDSCAHRKPTNQSLLVNRAFCAKFSPAICETAPASDTLSYTSDYIFQLKWNSTIDQELRIQNNPKKT